MDRAKFKEDSSKRDNFHRVIMLHFECGADVLRMLITTKLEKRKTKFKDYINACRNSLSGKKYVNQKQEDVLNSTDPQIQEMDVSFLTLVLLDKASSRLMLTDFEKTKISELRDKRNVLAHNSKGMLEDNKLHNETCDILLDLSKSVSMEYYKKMEDEFKEIQSRVFPRKYATLDIIDLCGESYSVILIKHEEDEKEVTTSTEILLKFNLTKWARQISRNVNAFELLKHMEKVSAISDRDANEIRLESTNFQQMNRFILFLVQKGTKKHVLEFCDCLRKSDDNAATLAADLIEGKNTDGRDTRLELQMLEENIICKFLQNSLQRKEKSDGVEAEYLHLMLEQEVGYPVKFDHLDQCVQKTFGCRHKDGRYDFLDFEMGKQSPIKCLETVTAEADIATFTFPEFVDYIAQQFIATDKDLSRKIKNVLENETIDLETFLDLEESEFEELFRHYEAYNIGIKKTLCKLQARIRTVINRPSDGLEKDLRPFDKPFNASYAISQVKYQVGNLLIPAHHFVQIKDLRFAVKSIANHTVQFVSACLNGRKNGTIHFGIRRTGKRTGQVIGMPVNGLEAVDDSVIHTIETCFGEKEKEIAKRCTRQAQIIPIAGESNLVVLEIDVVATSRYLEQSFFKIKYPPYGPHKDCFFLCEETPTCEIVPIPPNRVNATIEEYKSVIEERNKLELSQRAYLNKSDDIGLMLKEAMTSGADHITDEFYPIICLGPRSQEKHGELSLDDLKIDEALKHSVVVLDFDSSIRLLKRAENGTPYFDIRLIENLQEDTEKDLSDEKKTPWIFCNGKDNVNCEVMDPEDWIDRRMIPWRNLLHFLKESIPAGRAKVLFLVFEIPSENDPMIEVTRDAFMTTFKGQCLLYGEQEDVLSQFRKELSSVIKKENMNHFIFSGLKWKEFSGVLQNVFSENTSSVCKLPTSYSAFVELSQSEKDKLQFKDIEIVSSEECIMELNKMQKSQSMLKQKEEETNFYQGNTVSWWNFFFGGVGERDLFKRYRNIIERKLTEKEAKVFEDIVKIMHHPGSGGTTLGRHLIWHFSQSRCCSNPYRCCIIRRYTEGTIEEIERFRNFQDDTPKPIIVLIDNETDENVYAFKRNLRMLANKYLTPGNLIAVVILVSRVPFSTESYDITKGEDAKVAYILKHDLSRTEQEWFEKKYAELTKENVDVETLIAFNTMRNSFDRKYIAETVERFMKGISTSEKMILKVLALISTYENGKVIPSSVFDSIMTRKQATAVKKKKTIGIGITYGIMHMRRQREQLASNQTSHLFEIWFSNMTEGMKLFICRRRSDRGYIGLTIISHMLAEEILKFICQDEKLSLSQIVEFVIDHMKEHSKQKNSDSRRYVEVVCSLFKTRHSEDTSTGKGGWKEKFSRLIKALSEQSTIESGDEMCVRIIEKCFDVTKDGYVGQQLARFHILRTKNFEGATRAIEEAVKQSPHNSYLLDTFGQVYKSQVDHIKETLKSNYGKLSNGSASDIIIKSFAAIDKFMEGQKMTEEHEQGRNLSCYYMEVRTYLDLLESFETFQCYGSDEEFIEFLLDTDQPIKETRFFEINFSDYLEQMRKGNARYRHVEDVLRYIEEQDYQVKRDFYTVKSGDTGTLLLNLRGRFERFYRTHGFKYEIKFGFGLKQLMNASADPKQHSRLYERYQESERNLSKVPIENAHYKDLLIYVGVQILELLRRKQPNEEAFRRLLNFSSRLLETQRRAQRPYLEAFLYYALLHWPTPRRLKLFTNISNPDTYEAHLKVWEETFKNNHFIKSYDNMKGKTYFALGIESFGEEIIDLDEIDRVLRSMQGAEGQTAQNLYKSINFWRNDFVVRRLVRLNGVLDDTGREIRHTVEYPIGSHTFRIITYYPHELLRNREVTFVLAFTWSGIRAFDVLEKSPSNMPVQKQEMPVDHIPLAVAGAVSADSSDCRDSSLSQPTSGADKKGKRKGRKRKGKKR